jgi:hypothetical protein
MFSDAPAEALLYPALMAVKNILVAYVKANNIDNPHRGILPHIQGSKGVVLIGLYPDKGLVLKEFGKENKNTINFPYLQSPTGGN